MSGRVFLSLCLSVFYHTKPDTSSSIVDRIKGDYYVLAGVVPSCEAGQSDQEDRLTWSLAPDFTVVDQTHPHRSVSTTAEHRPGLVRWHPSTATPYTLITFRCYSALE